ncbi:MAG: DUF2075 domain-containing protein [Cephaloticoccus sp.]|nr:DUF2075 domain-containing protein [Cephaloticoccus sp.]
MIVYLQTKKQFQEDVLSNRIEESVLELFKQKLGKKVGDAEIASWRNSLPFMSRLLEDDEIPHDVGIAIEFNIQNTAKRIDFILTGKRADQQRTAVIIELKQWQHVSRTPMDAIVRTFVGGREREMNHPSYQAWSYSMLVEDYNETVRLDPIHLHPCAYLHNCDESDVINHQFYNEHTQHAPSFLRDDARKLRSFIKDFVKYGDSGETMYRIRDGKIRPSKNLADHLLSLLQGNREFFMIDDQKVVYEKALHLAEISTPESKNVLIVNGGPGTGKTVVAVNLLVELTNQKQVVQYVTKNSAPRAVYESKLTGSFRKSRISNLFVSSGNFTETAANTFQALLVDEAHRLNAKSGLLSNLGENQIKEIINASNFSVFFLDEDQRIHWKDIGSKTAIHEWAEALGAEVTELSLESQFRCNGSDGYLAWIDQTLGIRETANPTLEGIDYEFRICDSAAELRDLIYARNKQGNKARMVAGYCWDWITKTKNPSGYDIEFPDQGFAARWNLKDHGSLWIVKPDSVKEVGCIHTCQGLELDYIGVILGDDFLVRNGAIITDATKRSSQDRSMHGYRKLHKVDPREARKKAEMIIKNTYKTLMSRGQKGCYVYSADKVTNDYLKVAAVGAKWHDSILVAPRHEGLNLRLVESDKVLPYINAVPLFDLRVAAGDFSPPQNVTDAEWVELPDAFTSREGYFVTRVEGESMNRRIPNGAWCLFRSVPEGTRNGKVVIIRHRDIQDQESGDSLTIKLYFSEKIQTEDSWEHSKIILKPDTNSLGFSDIVLTPDPTSYPQVIGELVAVLP